MNIEAFWEAVLKQDEKTIRTYFDDGAAPQWRLDKHIGQPIH